MTTDFLDIDDDQDELLQPDDGDSDTLRTVRGRYKEAKKAARETKTVKEANEALQRENALLKAGLGELTEKQQRALFASHDGDLTPEKLLETAVELKMAEAPPPKVPEEQQQAHERIAAASGGAGTPVPGGADLTLAEVAGWGIDKKIKFREEHPTEWEAFQRGETVKRPTGW